MLVVHFVLKILHLKLDGKSGLPSGWWQFYNVGHLVSCRVGVRQEGHWFEILNLKIISHYFSDKMNFKKKCRGKLRVFDTFSGKSGLYNDENEPRKSTPVLLSMKQRPEEENVEPIKMIHTSAKAKGLRRQR